MNKSTDQVISILCCSINSEYKKLENVDCYDINRDAINFDSYNPIVAHPPCRSWSNKMAHFAKPLPGERELAHFCIDKLKSNGGVLEHPAYSKLFSEGYLPLPGEYHSDLKTIEVCQSWFGLNLLKRTWLCFSKIDLNDLIIPFNLYQLPLNQKRSTFDNLSKNQRSYSTKQFCDFLVNSARLTQC